VTRTLSSSAPLSDAGEVLAGFCARSRAEDEGVHTIVSPPLAERVGPFCVPNVTVSVLPETAMLDAVPPAPNAVKPAPIAPALSERLPRNGSGESEVR
jgi:hypothetical protein